MGWSIDWLLDGRLLMTGAKLGDTYVNGADFGFSGAEAPKRGYIKLVTPDGTLCVSTGGSSIVRGEVLQRVELAENRAPFALALGGPDRRALFIMTAERRPADSITDNLGRLTDGPRTGEVLSLPVSVPGTGRP